MCSNENPPTLWGRANIGGVPSPGWRRKQIATDATLPEIAVFAELDALGIALRNLIENAVRYGAPDEPIEILVEDRRSIRVLNGGPIVSAGNLEVLRKPFVRGSSAGNGSGLGLAIVENIMNQFGGALVLASPPKGRTSGFEAMLTLPETETTARPELVL